MSVTTGNEETLRIDPPDEYNRLLLENAHPPAWENPRSEGRYDLVVLGAGTAGLVTASGAAGLGARVALIEKRFLGGDCLHFGCVPSKALIRSSRAAADVRDAGRFGVRVPEGSRVDFPALMERMRELRARISPNDSAARFRGLGVDVFFGEAAFDGPDSVVVGGTRLRFKKAVIATGARPFAPSVPGLAEAGYLTNETVFSLTELPRRLAILGGGPIGSELSQAFARFGAEVILIEKGDRILLREDRAAARIVEDALRRSGVRIWTGCALLRVEGSAEGKRLFLEQDGKETEILADEILIGVGRKPNIEGLGLEAARVDVGRDGVKVNEYLQTTNRRIYAAGDVAFPYKFTHVADALARIAIQNALFFRTAKSSRLTIPWCTYTDPEIAHVGLYERDAEEKGIPTDTIRIELSDVDRAILDGEEEGFLKVLVRKGSDKILGATLVGRHAGEMISEVTLAMKAGAGLKALSGTIHPYPTQAEIFRKAGDAYNRTRLSPRLKKILSTWFRWRP
ncbi:MAG: mercuric reductase [Planctomycetota bacterium]